MSHWNGAERASSHRPISDYGLIGDCRTGALVSSDGSIDWLCAPDFDSPPLFDRLLDSSHGRCFSIQPAGRFESRSAYVGESAVLKTTFRTDRGTASLTDFMPLRAARQVVRLAEGIEGAVEMQLHARAARGLHSSAPCAERFTLKPAERMAFVLPLREPESDYRATPQAAGEALEQTLDFWRVWHAQCRYRGPHRDAVMRSLATLKLLMYAPTGAMVAAPTTSLPEEIGGVRNWDYRYTWIRDASFAFHALQALTHIGLVNAAAALAKAASL